MQIFLGSVDRGIWNVVLNGSFVPVNVVNDVQEPKPFRNGLRKKIKGLNMMLGPEI